MSGRLPQTFQPMRLTETGAILRGSLPLTGMTRLAASLHDTAGDVEIELNFGIDDLGTRYVQGHLRTALHPVCQRCLQVFDCPLEVEILLGVVTSERAATLLPEQYDPLLLDEPSIELSSLVEDELILALPIVPMHEPADCRFDPELVEVDEQGAADTAGPAAETRRPLAGLAEMLERRRERD
jgi:uncharacterized protein